MDITKIVHYWARSSEEDLKTADGLFRLKRYVHCLFFCHLFLEKILKALKADKAYTQKYLQECKRMYQWLKKKV